MGEDLEGLRADLTGVRAYHGFTRDRVGQPGCEVRQIAAEHVETIDRTLSALATQSTRIAELEEALRPFAEAAACGLAAYEIVKDKANELRASGATPLQCPQIGIATSIAQDKVAWADWCRASSVLSKGED